MGDVLRLSADSIAAPEPVSLTVNWIPKERFEPSARAIAGVLEELGCSRLIFQIESGRPDAVARSTSR